MGSRNIVIPIDLTKTGGVIVPTEGKVVYTSDTVSLIFNITGVTDYTGMNAAVALVMADGSVFQHERPITATPTTFLLQDNEVAHAGMVVGQVRFTDSSGSLTSQEFIFSIQASILDMPENLGGVREIEIDSFETLKEQVEGIQATVVANWDIVQANLDTMETTYAADWSAWFTTNKASITAEWVALKADINAQKAILVQDIAAAEANEATRVSAETIRLTAEVIRKTSESGRVEEEVSRAGAESGRVGAETARAAKENERKASETARVSSEAARSTAETTRVSHENERVAGESARIAQENARASAETARTSTASTDHAIATADHSTAVTDHTTNLADHAIVGGYNTRLTTVESDTVVSATNLITNGDFSNGTTGWLVNAGTVSVIFDSSLNRNVVEITGTSASYPGLRRSILNPNPTDKMYVSLLAKRVSGDGINASRPYFGIGVSAGVYFDSNTYTRMSTIQSITNTIFYILGGNSSNITATVRFADVSIINLTSTFGAGNEPTVEQMDKILAQFPNSWFNATENLFLAKQVLDRVNELDTRTEMVAQNLVVNGDFSNGTTGWTGIYGATLTVANKTLALKGAGVNSVVRVLQNLNFTPSLNDIYYVAGKMKVVSGSTSVSLFLRDGAGGNVIKQQIIHAPTPSTLYPISFVTPITSNTATLHLISDTSYPDAISTADKVTEIQYVCSINLTKIFGAGKEPTLAEMDRLMTHFSNSWFDGKQPLNTIRNLYTDKANKVQEAWITPTLLNGWTGSIGYAKNDTGMVNIYFDLIVGTGTAFTSILTLPITYAPKRNMVVRAINNSSGTAHDFRMYSSGGFHNLTTLTTGHNLSGVASYFAG